MSIGFLIEIEVKTLMLMFVMTRFPGDIIV